MDTAAISVRVLFLFPLSEEIQNKHIVTGGNRPCCKFGVKDSLSSQSLRDCALYSDFFVGATSSLILLNTTPSPKATSAVSEKVQTPSLSSIVSLSTKKNRMSVSSITSLTSEVHPVSSMADPTVIANLLPNKGECEILYSSLGVMEIGSKNVKVILLLTSGIEELFPNCGCISMNEASKSSSIKHGSFNLVFLIFAF